jgi:hypothetical protein
MNRHDRQPLPTEAELEYSDSDYRVLRPGAFVRCAVTGKRIPIEELHYWSAEFQEAYAGPQEVAERRARAARG